MENLYALAQTVLQADEIADPSELVFERFTSVKLYGAAARENEAAAGSDSGFHLENESGTGGHCDLSRVSRHRACLPAVHRALHGNLRRK